jgi:hypothetical protein
MGKRSKGKPTWIKETIALKDNHRWKTKPGYKIFVAGRGAVRFDVPQKWAFKPDEKSFKFFDKAPPDENCGLEVSFNLYPGADFSSVPLEDIVNQIAERDSRNVIAKGEVITAQRQTARIVWIELKFIDSQENREAFSRICVGLGSGVQCLITFDYWADDADRFTPVWDEVLRTLTLGLFIRDPSTGLAFPD